MCKADKRYSSVAPAGLVFNRFERHDYDAVANESDVFMCMFRNILI